jgi:tRNA pseudouridine55 synthase
MPPELNGIVVVDKPKGISSAGVVARIKGIFGVKKSAIPGRWTPLPPVSDLLPQPGDPAFPVFPQGRQSVRGGTGSGTVTDTQDATGTVTDGMRWMDYLRNRIEETAARFVGDITQVPPVYSALKHQGTRRFTNWPVGERPVEKPARPVRISRLEILEVNLPTVRLSVSCSAGTYIRTLCADIGRKLGCGGHLKALRRTASCGFHH